MGTIDTIPYRHQSVRVGLYTFNRMDDLPFRVWFRVIVAMVVAKAEKRRSRYDLAKLSARELRDIGLSEGDADAEIRKSFPNFVRNH